MKLEPKFVANVFKDGHQPGSNTSQTLFNTLANASVSSVGARERRGCTFSEYLGQVRLRTVFDLLQVESFIPAHPTISIGLASSPIGQLPRTGVVVTIPIDIR